MQRQARVWGGAEWDRGDDRSIRSVRSGDGLAGARAVKTVGRQQHMQRDACKRGQDQVGWKLALTMPNEPLPSSQSSPLGFLHTRTVLGFMIEASTRVLQEHTEPESHFKHSTHLRNASCCEHCRSDWTLLAVCTTRMQQFA